jgi:hypothetical protein
MVAPVPAQISKLRPLDVNTRTKLPAPLSASRGVNISPVLNSFRILPVGVHSIRRPQARSFRRSEAPSLLLARSCRLFALSLQPFPLSLPLFSVVCSLFFKNTRGGIPLGDLARWTEVQKCFSVSPLLATLAHSVSRKSFPCHSYENTRDGVSQVPLNCGVLTVGPETRLEDWVGA